MNHSATTSPLEGTERLSSSMRAIGINPEKDFDFCYKQLSEISGLSARSLRRLVAEGKLGCIRHSQNKVTIPLSEWRAYRELNRVAPKVSADGRNS